ncbi:MAG TPA: alcohol dehydrogenase catalytic domain-containing protein [Afifellaceae bacterium]|nr:alcohol dehydrogenase catalytic domain-containing protein [Afifellaceae bacterium]
MDVRAAVAFEAGKPLEITNVQLEGPKEGEVLVEIKATGICHTDDFTLSGADPEGLFPSVLGHERAGIVVDVGPGVTSVKRPFQLVTGRVWKGTAFGGARGRTDVPKIVEWYMDGKIEIDPMITHVLPLEDINKGFELMHQGESIRSVVVY